MPRNIIFVAPFPIETTMRFARAASKLDDVRLLGIVHTPPDAGSPDARMFDDVIRITDPLSGQDVLDGVEVLKRRHGQPDRIIGILEPLMVQMAEARERYGVPGTRARRRSCVRSPACAWTRARRCWPRSSCADASSRWRP
jgi:hypothetical protein